MTWTPKRKAKQSQAIRQWQRWLAYVDMSSEFKGLSVTLVLDLCKGGKIWI
jgi:hypothetical protein